MELEDLPKDSKFIDFPDIVDQRLALAKWMASNRSQCDIDGHDIYQITQLLYSSELFGLQEGKPIILTDLARTCANSIRLEIMGMKEVEAYEINGVDVKTYDIAELDKTNDFTDEELKELQAFKNTVVFGTQISLNR